MNHGPGGTAAPDPGLQPERTRLARRRTGLSIATVAVLTVRLALSYDALVTLLLGGAVALGLLALGATVIRGATRAGAHVTGGRSMPLLALVAVGYAGLGVLLVLGALG
ncbi:hypothetical protein BDK92_4981 [Micromonospora pisi]|uniref:DUF202 domain-containing protein n=1 Tax=Micromonospora pisi TaxID=589240 RepID=A0A495JNT1_9ACTN|nr:DUF202 domain-containing protein [Micromonospora pisi]RKR90603.1 hypothetical protein BDK92_4981 [Micromonospora pisi]